MALDRDSPLALQVHIVKHLILLLTVSQGSCKFKQAVGQGALPMVNMSYDTKVARIFHRCKFTPKSFMFITFEPHASNIVLVQSIAPESVLSTCYLFMFTGAVICM
jgi:hypothetical protein